MEHSTNTTIRRRFARPLHLGRTSHPWWRAVATVAGVFLLCGVGGSPAAAVSDTDSPAGALNERYALTDRICDDGTASFFCTGVMLRVTNYIASSDSQRERDGVSFSFVRADTGIRTLYQPGAGFILRPWAEHQSVVTARCAFPNNGDTASRVRSCGPYLSDLDGPSRPCAEQGVTTVPSWIAFATSGDNASCAFAVDAEPFALSIDVRPHLSELERAWWNEVVIRPWADEAIATLPIEAIFYQAQDEAGGLRQAEALRDELIGRGGPRVPLVRMDLAVLPGTPVFSDTP